MMVFCSLVLLCLQSLAFGKTFPWGYFPFDLGRWLWLFITASFFFQFLFPSKKIKEHLFLLFEKSGFLRAWLFTNLVYLGFSYFQFAHFGYSLPLLASGVVLAGLFFVRQDKPLVSLTINLLILGCSLVQFPIHIDRSDMLIVTQNAMELLAKGMDPYLELHEKGRAVTYGYLPGIFLSYFPAWSLGLDLRWNNLIFRALWLFLLLRVIKNSKKKEALIPFHYLALSPYINFRHDLYFEAFLFLLVAYFALSKTRYLCLPLMLITLQWSWIIAPFLVLNDLREHPRRKLQILGLYLGCGFATALGIYWILNPVVVWKAMLEKMFWFQKVVGDAQFNFDYGLNLKWLFLKLGLLHWMQRLQALILAGIFLGVITKKLKGSSLNWAAVALFLFLVLNGHFWLYFWNTPIIFCILVAATQEV